MEPDHMHEELERKAGTKPGEQAKDMCPLTTHLVKRPEHVTLAG